MREHSGLLTDLYELTMAAGYLQTGFEARATFELFVRNLPPQRNYLVAAGLDQALDSKDRFAGIRVRTKRYRWRGSKSNLRRTEGHGSFCSWR